MEDVLKCISEMQI